MMMMMMMIIVVEMVTRILTSFMTLGLGPCWWAEDAQDQEQWRHTDSHHHHRQQQQQQKSSLMSGSRPHLTPFIVGWTLVRTAWYRVELGRQQIFKIDTYIIYWDIAGKIWHWRYSYRYNIMLVRLFVAESTTVQCFKLLRRSDVPSVSVWQSSFA